jgi:hypothetical protein
MSNMYALSSVQYMTKTSNTVKLADQYIFIVNEIERIELSHIHAKE